MGWAIWLSVPVVATVVASLATWWSAHRERRRRRRRSVDGARRDHQRYLDALTVPARGSARVPPGDRR
jgi:hypothetical protein